MKHLRLLCASAALLLFTSCIWNFEDDVPVETLPMTNYDAVVMQRDEFENAVQLIPAQAVVKSGKIYVNNNLLFVNDVNKGFHIYDYSDPSNPVPVAFLKVPGATDLTMRNNVLFINQATDLVTMTYNAGDNAINITKRNRNVFPPKLSPDSYYEEVSENEVIIDWVQL